MSKLLIALATILSVGVWLAACDSGTNGGPGTVPSASTVLGPDSSSDGENEQIATDAATDAVPDWNERDATVEVVQYFMLRSLLMLDHEKRLSAIDAQLNNPAVTPELRDIFTSMRNPNFEAIPHFIGADDSEEEQAFKNKVYNDMQDQFEQHKEHFNATELKDLVSIQIPFARFAAVGLGFMPMMQGCGC